MEQPTQEDFSSECPNCGAPGRPVTQRNNFEEVEPSERSGEPPIRIHRTTSRGYRCDRCENQWDETVPFPR